MLDELLRGTIIPLNFWAVWYLLIPFPFPLFGVDWFVWVEIVVVLVVESVAAVVLVAEPGAVPAALVVEPVAAVVLVAEPGAVPAALAAGPDVVPAALAAGLVVAVV
jgi:hypothetical protein